ncbi:unnamed protein product, partial [Didymodactylos carnosus]
CINFLHPPTEISRSFASERQRQIGLSDSDDMKESEQYNDNLSQTSRSKISNKMNDLAEMTYFMNKK